MSEMEIDPPSYTSLGDTDEQRRRQKQKRKRKARRKKKADKHGKQ